MREKNSGNLVSEDQMQQKSLEEMFEELEDILEKTEGSQVSLEESFQLYKQGMTILKKCNDKIDKVEKEVLILDESGGLYEF